MAYAGSAFNTTGASAGTSLVVTGTPANGTRILAAVMRGDVSDIATTQPSTVPSGFTLLGSANNSIQNNGKLGVIHVYEKLVASSEAGSYTWGYGVASDFSVAMTWFTGRHASTAATIQASSEVGSGTTPVSASISGITAATDDDVAAFHAICGNAYSGAWTGTAPTNYTERVETDSGGGAFGHYLSTRDAVSSGATGALVATLSNGALTADYFGVVVGVPVSSGGAAVNPDVRRFGPQGPLRTLVTM